MAVETLRPNAAGDECLISLQTGAACPDHYLNVDEVAPDGHTTEVYTNAVAYERDLYNIQDHSVGSGTINSVTVYAYCMRADIIDTVQASLKIACKTGGVAYEDVERTLTAGWVYYSKVWAANPGGGAWTWAQIDALQVGVAMRRGTDVTSRSYCTQVYVEVDYTLPGWTGKVSGVTNPAKVMGVDVANIAKVHGVA